MTDFVNVFHSNLPLAAASVAGPAALATLFRPRAPRDETATAYGTARWATRRDLVAADLFRESGLVLGRQVRGARAGRLLRSAGDRHLLTVAPTRSGKGVGTVIPNLLTWPGSAIVIDPKGENARATARIRAALGHRVHVLDGWGITGLPSARYNPLDSLDPQSPDLGDDVALAVDALMPATAASGSALFWENEQRALGSGIILHIVTAEPPARRTLAYLRHLLTLPPAEFDQLLAQMSESEAAGGLVARAAHRILQKHGQERSGVISSAQAQTHILDSPCLTDVMARSDFSLADLRERPTTIYLVLPGERLEGYGRWLRLMISMSLATLARTPSTMPWPVLFLLDEFSALGRLDSVQTAIGLFAGYQVQLWPIVQDLAMLRDLYGERWTSFIANAGIVQSFATNDAFTAQAISKLLGTRTVRVQATGRSHNPGGDGKSATLSATGRPLLFPAELMRLPPDEQVLLVAGRPPIRAKRIRWYKDDFFLRIAGQSR